MKRLITDKKYDINDAKLVAEYNRGLESIATESCIGQMQARWFCPWRLIFLFAMPETWIRSKPRLV